YVERLAAFVEFEGGALQVHAEFSCPLRRTIRGSTPPDAFAQARRMGLEAQKAGRVREHGLRAWFGKAFAAQDIKQHFGMAASHIGVGLAFCGLVAEIAPTVDHLFGRAAAD